MLYQNRPAAEYQYKPPRNHFSYKNTSREAEFDTGARPKQLGYQYYDLPMYEPPMSQTYQICSSPFYSGPTIFSPQPALDEVNTRESHTELQTPYWHTDYQNFDRYRDPYGLTRSTKTVQGLEKENESYDGSTD